MAWLFAGGEVLAGVIVLVLWWLAMKLAERRGKHTQLTSMRFAVLPGILLLWFVGGVILLMRGVGLIG